MLHDLFATFVCDCSFVLFYFSSELHKKLHTGEAVKCPHCDYEASCQAWLRKHMLVHGEKSENIRQQYLCQYCGKGYGRQYRLSEHISSELAITGYVDGTLFSLNFKFKTILETSNTCSYMAGGLS